MDKKIDEIEKQALEGEEHEILIKLQISGSTIDFLSWMEARFQKDTRRCVRYLVYFGDFQRCSLESKGKPVYVEFCKLTSDGEVIQYLLGEVLTIPTAPMH